MKYEEMVAIYNNMSLREFGARCKDHFNSEENILGSITSVLPELTGAAIISMVENYNAMHLNFRHTNFMMRLYIEAVNKGIIPTWHDDSYKKHLSNYRRNVVEYRSLENGLELFVEKYAAQYKRDRFFDLNNNSSFSSEDLKKAYNSFAAYGSDEKSLFYRRESLFGFSAGFVGTDKRIYFSNKSKFSVKYENILDFYFEYNEEDTGLTLPLFRFEDIKTVIRKVPGCLKADNVKCFLKIIYIDEKTGEVCDHRFSDRCVWDNMDNVTLAWLFTQLLKDIIIVKNYDRYIEVSKTIEPEFAESDNGNGQDAISCLTEMYREMSLKKLGLKCRELLASESEVANYIGKSGSDEISMRITELVNNYTVLGLDYRLHSFMMNMLVKAAQKDVSLDVVSQFKPELTAYFNGSHRSIVTAIDEFIRNVGLKAYIEKMNNEKGQIKKIEKAKKAFATIGFNEQILLYCSESILGFSKGFIITDKRMYFSTDRIFSVSYENVLDFCIKSKYNVEISAFRIADLEKYAQSCPDTFRKDSWHIKVLYKGENSDEVYEGDFKSFSIDDLETAKNLFALTDVIKNYTFVLKYMNYLR